MSMNAVLVMVVVHRHAQTRLVLLNAPAQVVTSSMQTRRTVMVSEIQIDS